MTEAPWQIIDTALANDVFAGGLGLGLIGAALAALRLGLGALLGWLWRRLTLTVSVDSRSPAYRDLALWLAGTDALSRARRLRLAEFAEGGETGPRPDAEDPVLFSFGFGRHRLVANGVLCIVDRGREERQTTGGQRSGPLETLELTLLGGRRERVAAWLAEGAQAAAARRRCAPTLWCADGDSDWTESGVLTPRTLASVIGRDEAGLRLRDDLARFLGAREWYAERGIPWRRGYLLHGPPGTGKSSLIRAVASDLELDIAILEIAGSGITDYGLRRALIGAPRSALLALEDVDAVFAERSRGEAAERLSFSGLLNSIDGVAAQEGRALVMTTNHPERLDPALVRPGRVDLRIELGPVGAPEAARMVRRFFPGDDRLAERVAAALGPRRIAPAALQGWLLAEVDRPAPRDSSPDAPAIPSAIEPNLAGLLARSEGAPARPEA